MPELPSGLRLALNRRALFDHGGNWFHCPPGHFWYWVADPEMGEPPFDGTSEILCVTEHAQVPRSREEAKQFVRVVVITPDNMVRWDGEWLERFPRYMDLDEADRAAWSEWLEGTGDFLDEVIAECQRLAKVSQQASGFARVTMEGGEEASDTTWKRAQFRKGDAANRSLDT